MTNCLECGEPQNNTAFFCEKCGAPLFVGKRAGIYEIKERIGEGGMGAVYKAEHTKLGTPFALKILHRQFSRRHDLVERFVKEARATSRLRHENIVFITDFGEFEGFGPFIAMEYLEGQPLKHALTPGDPLDIVRALSIAIQIADTMAYAHGEGIVHRDLKPDNIFLIHRKHNDADFIKVLDFGIAKMFDDDSEKSLTQTGAVLGTPIYMPPEQALSQPLDHRADIYAFGVILFEMITGYLPFQGDSAFELIEKRLFHPAPNISTFAPQWADSPMETLVALCLMREPEERVQSMAEVKQELAQLREHYLAHALSSAPSGRLKTDIDPGIRRYPGDQTPIGSQAEGESVSTEHHHNDNASTSGAVAEAAPPRVSAQQKEPHRSRGALPTSIEQWDGPEVSAKSQSPKQSQKIQAPLPAVEPVLLTSEFVTDRPSRLWVSLLLLVLCGGGAFAWLQWRALTVAPPTQARVKGAIPAQGQEPVPPPRREPQPPGRRASAPSVAPDRPVIPDRPAIVRRVRSQPVVRRHRKRRIKAVRHPDPRPIRQRTKPQPPRPIALALAIGPNGCPVRTERHNYIKMRANDPRVHVCLSTHNVKCSKPRLPRAKGGGWCLKVPRGGIHVFILGEHRELADCWFKLGYLSRRSFKVKLRNLEDGGAGTYCYPR